MKTADMIFDEFWECIEQVGSPYATIDVWAKEIDYVIELNQNLMDTLWMVRFNNGIEYLIRGRKLSGMWIRLSITELNWNDFDRMEDE